MAKTMVDFKWDEILQRLNLNQEQFAGFLDVSASVIRVWRRAGTIPLEHYHVALAITAEMAEGVQSWVEHDLRDLRSALGYTQDDMAGELHSSVARIAAWEKRGEIPHDRLGRVMQLRHQTMNVVTNQAMR